MAIWFVIGGMALVVAVALGWALAFGHRDTGPAAQFDLQVYRDQLREMERDAARGIVAPEEAERLRTEIARRMLSADAKTQEASAAAGSSRWGHLAAAIALVLAVAGGGVAIYGQLGAPAYDDLPLERRIALAQEALVNRPGQAEVEARMPSTLVADVPAEYLELVERLRATVAERPDDIQGHVFLTRSEAALGDFAAAHAAQARVVALKGAGATAEDFAVLADLRVLAAGGYVSPEAEEALTGALRIDPTQGLARYYVGLLMAQTGRPDVAFRMWRTLLNDSAADDPWIPAIRAQIEEMAELAGDVNYRLPPEEPQSGPSAEDIAAAQDLSPEEQAEMIRGMVARLSDRLATEGGSAADWARLIRAYGVLGDRNAAQAIYTEARVVFAEDADALRDIYRAAQDAEIVN